MATLIDLHFDKGNGAIFEVDYLDQRVRCFVSQDNSFLAKKASPGQDFPSVLERYSSLIASAAVLNIARLGVSTDPWGNLISESDIASAQALRRSAI